MPQGLIRIIRPAPPEKTNPIKPNLSRRSPPTAGRSRIKPKLAAAKPHSKIRRAASSIKNPAQLTTHPMALSRKTNPISQTTESPQPLIPQRLTPIFRPATLKKTNPIKPNLSRRSLGRSRIPLPDSSSVVFRLSSVVVFLLLFSVSSVLSVAGIFRFF